MFNPHSGKEIRKFQKSFILNLNLNYKSFMNIIFTCEILNYFRMLLFVFIVMYITYLTIYVIALFIYLFFYKRYYFIDGNLPLFYSKISTLAMMPEIYLISMYLYRM